MSSNPTLSAFYITRHHNRSYLPLTHPFRRRVIFFHRCEKISWKKKKRRKVWDERRVLIVCLPIGTFILGYGKHTYRILLWYHWMKGCAIFRLKFTTLLRKKRSLDEVYDRIVVLVRFGPRTFVRYNFHYNIILFYHNRYYIHSSRNIEYWVMPRQ